MADEKPLIRVFGFSTTYELLPVKGKDPLNDTVDSKGYLLKDGKRVMERGAEDWVTYSPAHSPLNTKTTERVRHMIPDHTRLGDDADGARLAFMQMRWSQIEPAYEAWKKGQEIPMSGTPLAAWPGINTGQMDVLRSLGIRTVEEVRDLTENQLERVKLPNMRDLRNQARLFIENTGAAASAAREAEKDVVIDTMRQQMDEMRAMIAKLSPAETDEVATLRATLDALGIDYDKRWAAPKLRALLPVADAA